MLTDFLKPAIVVVPRGLSLLILEIKTKLARRNQTSFHALTLQDFNKQFPVFIKLKRLVKLLMNENVLPAAFLWAFSPLFHFAMGQPGIQTGGRK